MNSTPTTGLAAPGANHDFELHLREMNDALLVSAVRQHELAEQMEKADALVRESEERYRALFELVPTAVYSCDTSGVIREFNRRAAELWGREPAFGVTDERFCGSFKLFRPDGSFMPHDQCPMAEVLSGTIAEARDAEVLIERPDGARITVVVNIRSLKNERGEVTGAINCFYDITQRKRLEEELRQHSADLSATDHRKDEFLAMLGHELRNPLAPISYAVQLLRLQKSQDKLQHQACAIIDRQVAQLTRLVDDLLEVSRITTGKIHLQQERIALNGVADRAVETTRPLMDQRNHEFTVSLSPRPIWLYADAARLEQVVVNLLTNAAKYTADGGHIALAVRQEGDEALLLVRDTGVGIAADLLPRIFDLFTQAERSLDRAQGGLGIGLSLVHGLVEMHGGRVEVHSALGQGSEFVVHLPLWKDQGGKRKDEPNPADSSPLQPPASLKVLVVDDNVDAAQSLGLLLEASGYDVRKAHDGLTALDAALHYRPNVVLLDIGLPGIDGFEVAKRLHQQPELRGVVLVAMTGYGQISDKQRSQEAGFNHHLVKPADFGKVLQILATVSVRDQESGV